MLTALQKRKLMKLFSMYDADCTGSLAKDDFELLLKKMASMRNWSVRSPRYLVMQDQLMRMWNGLAKKADKSHDKTISLNEWLAFKEDVLASETAYSKDVHPLMELIFDVFDEDEDGKLSEDDWGRLLSAYNVSPIYAAIAFPALTPEDDGRITKTSLLKSVRAFYYSDDENDPANGMFGPY